jgi:hypothetical protein
MKNFFPLFSIAITVLVCLLLFSSCKNSISDELASYYFPVDELQNGRVYAYETANNPNDPPFFWWFRTIEQDSGVFVTRMEYDYRYLPFQFVREERVSNGMLLKDMYLYETDSTNKQQKIDVRIEHGNSFAFGEKDPSKVLLYKIAWEGARGDDDITTSLTKNRQYIGDTVLTFKGTEYDCARFYVRELVELDAEDHFEVEYDGEEIYARGLGMIYFKKNVTEELVTEYRLVDTFGMEVLEERFGRSLGR